MHEILVIDDDATTRTALGRLLRLEGFSVSSASDGAEALEACGVKRPDLILSDVTMPRMNGFVLCETIRKRGWTLPLIFLTGRSAPEDRILGFKLGADDYVTKPFSTEELLFRVKAVLRRTSPANEEDIFKLGTITVHPGHMTLTRANGESVHLVAREMKILRLFAQDPQAVLSRDRLLNEVWGLDYYGTTRTVDQHISNLRKKLEPDVAILSIRGEGYRLEPASR